MNWYSTLFSKMAYSDEIATKTLKNGDKKAFTWIYNKYFRQLCIYAKEIVEDLKTAEDIVHDLFAILWENREKIDITSSLKTYLFVSTRNFCLKHLYHINVRRKYQDSYLNENSEASESDNPMSKQIAKETENEIERALNALPKKYREITVLALVKELSYTEIAEKLNIPVNSIGPLFYRARKMLRKNLENVI